MSIGPAFAAVLEAVEAALAPLRACGHPAVPRVRGVVHAPCQDFDAVWIVRELLQRDLAQEIDRWVFVGDSGNDQAMFEHFTHSVGVANIRRFESALTHLPPYITPSERGAGFAEVATALLEVATAQ